MKTLSLILVTALTLNASGFAYQTTLPRDEQTQTQTQKSDKAKSEVQRRGIGENSQVKVKLRGNEGEVKGYISRIDETSFQVTEQKSGRVRTINYADVDRIRGTGLSTGAKIAIAAGIGAAGIVIGILASLAISGE